jgi:hypothetical protein
MCLGCFCHHLADLRVELGGEKFDDAAFAGF